jgi:hypothetical protein
VYPNDHPPHHTHVLGPGWEIRIELSMPPVRMTIVGKPKMAEITAALRALSARYDSRKKCIVIGLENGAFFLFHPTWLRAWPTPGPPSWLTLKFRRKALGCIGPSSTQI